MKTLKTYIAELADEINALKHAVKDLKFAMTTPRVEVAPHGDGPRIMAGWQHEVEKTELVAALEHLRSASVNTERPNMAWIPVGKFDLRLVLESYDRLAKQAAERSDLLAKEIADGWYPPEREKGIEFLRHIVRVLEDHAAFLQARP